MKKFVLSMLSVLCIVAFISCGSKPAGEDGTETEAPVVKAEVDNALALSNLDNARNAAIESGAQDKAPELFNAIDSLYNSAKEKADSKEDLSAECQDISDRYLALTNYLSAIETKEKVEKTEKISIVQDLYDEGCTALSDTEALFSNPDATGAQLLESATKANTCFNSVLFAIYKQVAHDERTAALESQKNANSVKAQVSMKDKYNEAVALFKKGDTLYSMQDPAKAYDNYKEANEIFDTIYKEVSEKRAAALKAIEDAKKAVEESASLAEEADTENPITAPVEGIEEEDTVLLEEDTYEDPAAAEVELSEEVSDPVQDKIDEAVDAVEESAEKAVDAWDDK